jgi:hypothetical protein
MNRANPPPLDSKADNSKIEIERSVNVNSASVKNKAGVNRAAVNRAAVSKAEDKTGFRNQTSGGIYPAAFYLRPSGLLKAKLFCYARRRSN